ncbi:MAG: hypothetical protein ACYDHY_05130 [Acidiferrobacterales bacterium]
MKSGASGCGKKGAKYGVLWDNIAEKPAVTMLKPLIAGIQGSNAAKWTQQKYGTEERT